MATLEGERAHTLRREEWEVKSHISQEVYELREREQQQEGVGTHP
jgi:hypothetical protein